ncbi:hypothetical protein BU23DRAFT_660703 [Bimuria novae-zelandiae CBS 107.79]|uniref:Uncharacterized protein n=1 Tax=Bimuria novae-zelandiae CBS 107.79 TaxID=1447943 RepID=A0A6A5UQX5_9PLEO|nr:hypothetical protein BU23DRAFT_660703 [Bimuria novae-zelandiae CBS 107.79]
MTTIVTQRHITYARDLPRQPRCTFHHFQTRFQETHARFQLTCLGHQTDSAMPEENPAPVSSKTPAHDTATQASHNSRCLARDESHCDAQNGYLFHTPAQEYEPSPPPYTPAEPVPPPLAYDPDTHAERDSLRSHTMSLPPYSAAPVPYARDPTEPLHGRRFIEELQVIEPRFVDVEMQSLGARRL